VRELMERLLGASREAETALADAGVEAVAETIAAGAGTTL